MKKNFLAFLRMFVFAALMPSLALSLVSCDPDNGVEDAVEDALGGNNGTNSGVDGPFEELPVSEGEVVDLGLSVKWANKNLGAESYEEFGGYYAWGEIEERASWVDFEKIPDVYSVLRDTLESFKSRNELTDEKIDELLKDKDSVEYKVYAKSFFDEDYQVAFGVALAKFQEAIREKIEESELGNDAIQAVLSDVAEESFTGLKKGYDEPVFMEIVEDFLLAFMEPYNWGTYKWCAEKSSEALTKYCVDKKYGKDGFVDGKLVLDLEDDAARAQWGESWRMPTKEEFEELRDKCRWKWVTIEDENGRKIQGYKVMGNGNCIFLPAAGYRSDLTSYNRGSYGYYWSSSLNSGDSNDVYSLGFGDGFYGWSDWNGWYGTSRHFGHSIRPVTEQ